MKYILKITVKYVWQQGSVYKCVFYEKCQQINQQRGCHVIGSAGPACYPAAGWPPGAPRNSAPQQTCRDCKHKTSLATIGDILLRAQWLLNFVHYLLNHYFRHLSSTRFDTRRRTRVVNISIRTAPHATNWWWSAKHCRDAGDDLHPQCTGRSIIRRWFCYSNTLRKRLIEWFAQRVVRYYSGLEDPRARVLTLTNKWGLPSGTGFALGVICGRMSS